LSLSLHFLVWLSSGQPRGGEPSAPELSEIKKDLRFPKPRVMMKVAAVMSLSDGSVKRECRVQVLDGEPLGGFWGGLARAIKSLPNHNWPTIDSTSSRLSQAD